MIDRRYIIIEGNIGAGKTTLATKIADEFAGKLILEQFHDNPFLPKFYQNPDRYSFSLELAFLAARYKQLNSEIASTDLFKAFTIADYYFVKSLIFARSTLQTDEYNLYRQLFDIIYNQLPLPDFYLYLHVEPGQLLVNIDKRGRDYEKTIQHDYLLQIQKSYFDYFKSESRFPIVVVESSKLNFVDNPADYQMLVDIIFKTQFTNGLNRVVF